MSMQLHPAATKILNDVVIGSSDYIEAKNKDFEQYAKNAGIEGQEQFFQINNTIKGLLMEVIDSDDPGTTIAKTKGQIIQLTSIKKSHQRKWALKYLNHLERTCIAREQKKITLPITEPNYDQVLANHKIINIFKKQDPELILNSLLHLLKPTHNEDATHPINFSTIMHRLGKFSQTTDLSPFLEKIDELLKIITRKFCALKEGINHQTLSNLLYGFQNLEPSEATEDFLTLIAERITQSVIKLNGQEIAMSLYGLKKMPNSESAKKIILLLKNKVDLSPDSQMNNQALNLAFLGIKYFEDTPELRAILPILSLKLGESSDHLNAKEITDIFQSIQNFYDAPETLNIISILADRINQTKIEFHPNQIGLICKCLNGFTDTLEIRKTLSLLEKQFKKTNFSLNPYNISTALYGLCNMEGSPELQSFISSLNSLIQESNDYFNGENISMCFYGLKSAEESEEIKDLVATLTNHIKTANFNTNNFSMIIYGIQNLKNSPETNSLLKKITKKLNQSNTNFIGQDIGMILYGIKNLKGSPQLPDFFETLFDKIVLSRPRMNMKEFHYSLLGLYQHQNLPEAKKIIDYLFITLKQLNNNLHTVEILIIVQLFALFNKNLPEKFELKYPLAVQAHQNSSYSEKKLLEEAQELMPNTEVLMNHFIDGYELDLYFPSLGLNIEFDGPFHKHPHKIFKTEVRDEHLFEQHDILVERICYEENPEDRILEILSSFE